MNIHLNIISDSIDSFSCSDDKKKLQETEAMSPANSKEHVHSLDSFYHFS